jgi:hypothetical protein
VYVVPFTTAEFARVSGLHTFIVEFADPTGLTNSIIVGPVNRQPFPDCPSA